MPTITKEQLEAVNNHPDYQLLQRINMSLPTTDTRHRTFNATIIDLETMGVDPKTHEVIEIGLLSFNFSNEDGILSIRKEYYNATIFSDTFSVN